MTAMRDRMRAAVRGKDLPPVFASPWAVRLAVFAAALVLSGGLLHRFAGLSTPAALNVFLLGFILAGFSIVFAIWSLVRVWLTARRGTAGALTALAIASAILAWPAAYLPIAMATEPLNDVSTDTTSPPALTRLQPRRPVGANATTYPGSDFAQRQAELYPDIQPFAVQRRVGEAYELARQALQRQQIEIVAERPPEANRPGLIEGVDRTLILGFRDDVAVRVASIRGGALIDVRSASRWGVHDFGRNAYRVREILRGIVQRLQLTVPSTGREPTPR